MAMVARRKCRNEACGKTALMSWFLERCPHCGTEYGKWELGFDQEVLVTVKGKAK